METNRLYPPLDQTQWSMRYMKVVRNASMIKKEISYSSALYHDFYSAINHFGFRSQLPLYSQAHVSERSWASFTAEALLTIGDAGALDTLAEGGRARRSSEVCDERASSGTMIGTRSSRAGDMVR